jgi:hypothetical protein
MGNAYTVSDDKKRAAGYREAGQVRGVRPTYRSGSQSVSRSSHHKQSDYDFHVIQTVRSLGGDPFALDEGCAYRVFNKLVKAEPPEELGTAVERRLAALEGEVEALKRELAQRSPTPKAIALLDALISNESLAEGLPDIDDEHLTMALTVSEDE